MGGGQPHASATSTPGKDPVPIVQEAGWAPEPVWTGGKSRPHRDTIPCRPARSSVAIPTELPGPQDNDVSYIKLSVCVKHHATKKYRTWVDKQEEGIQVNASSLFSCFLLPCGCPRPTSVPVTCNIKLNSVMPSAPYVALAFCSRMADRQQNFNISCEM